MGILIEKFKSDFHLIKSGNKGWYISQTRETGLYCPFCHNENSKKIAFIFSNICSFHCVKCGESMRLEKYLWKIKKTEYIDNQKFLQIKDTLEKKELIIKKEEENYDEKLEEVSLPLFFKRIKYSSYLQNRGAKLDIYKYWNIGKTDFEEELKGFLIFLIPENGKNVGWVARNQKSKKEIDEYNKNHKNKILRWKNSRCDFAKIVFGLDEINENTKKIIIVEGITSKMKVDCNLQLYKQHEVVCCCTFGKKISKVQLFKIKNKGINVQDVILFFDSDAIKSSKKNVYELTSVFKNVEVAFCNFKDEEGNYKDAGDLNKEELCQVLSNTQTPFIFFESKMEKKKLY